MKRSLLLLVMLTSLLAARPAGAAADARPQSANPYVKVELGDLPIVLGVPHGGSLRPSEIPDRTEAVVVNDPGIRSFALELADAMESKTGRRPSLVLNELDRVKLDPNRSLTFGAQGDPVAGDAWEAYHRAIGEAAQRAVAICGRGHFFDLHSHGEPGRWLEFGYGLSAEDLHRSDEDLDKRRFLYQSNWRALALLSPTTLAELVRGPNSLGGRLDAAGYRALPSPENPKPQPGYFDGGYSVYRHGSHLSGAIDATQIEVPFDLIQGQARQRLVDRLAEAILGLMQSEYKMSVNPADSRLCPAFVDLDPADPAYAAVEALDRSGGASACTQEPRRLCPNESLSRAEAAPVIWRALYPAALVPRTGEPVFADVEESAAETKAAQVLWQRGFLGACGTLPLMYCPQARFSRADLAKVVLKIQRGRAYLPPPPDDDGSGGLRSNWGMWWVTEAVRAGLLRPCPPRMSGRTCASQPVSRLELASGLAYALGWAAPP